MHNCSPHKCILSDCLIPIIIIMIHIVSCQMKGVIKLSPELLLNYIN